MIKTKLIALCCIFGCSVLNSNAWAQELPSAEKVIETYIEKTGGRKVYDGVRNARFTGEIAIPAAGLKGEIEIVFSSPDRFYFKSDMGALGVQERGSNGKVVWENSTIQGARIIEGDEADQMLQEVSMGTIRNPLKFYQAIKTTGKEKVNGEECFVVELTKKSGDVDRDYYSIKSGLRLKSVKKVDSPLGKLEVESFETDYKETRNGPVISWSGEQKVGPNSITMKMKTVEFNGKIDETRFVLPEAVKELIDE